MDEVVVSNKKYDVDKIFFDLDADNKITLYFKNFKHRNYEDYLEVRIIFLDILIGEYLVMTSISSIKCMPLEKKSEISRPLTELPLVFEDEDFI